MILYSPQFENYINNLIDVLYENEYFGFEFSSIDYTLKIYDYIFENIDKPISKITPKKFQKHGKKYLRYKANQNTSWYIFFDEKNENFLVNYILNNHDKDFPELL